MLFKERVKMLFLFFAKKLEKRLTTPLKSDKVSKLFAERKTFVGRKEILKFFKKVLKNS